MVRSHFDATSEVVRKRPSTHLSGLIHMRHTLKMPALAPILCQVPKLLPEDLQAVNSRRAITDWQNRNSSRGQNPQRRRCGVLSTGFSSSVWRPWTGASAAWMSTSSTWPGIFASVSSLPSCDTALQDREGVWYSLKAESLGCPTRFIGSGAFSAVRKGFQCWSLRPPFRFRPHPKPAPRGVPRAGATACAKHHGGEDPVPGRNAADDAGAGVPGG